MRLRAAREVVALDRPLEALALGAAGDLHLVAGRKRLHADGLPDEQLADLVAELDHVPVRPGIRLLQEPQIRLGERLLFARTERELHGLVAVAIDGADPGHRARPCLQHGYPLDAAVLPEPLGHPELLGEGRGQGTTRRDGSRYPRRPAYARPPGERRPC